MKSVQNIQNTLQAKKKKKIIGLKHKLKFIAFTICHDFRNAACPMCSKFVIITRLMWELEFLLSHNIVCFQLFSETVSLDHLTLPFTRQ